MDIFLSKTLQLLPVMGMELLKDIHRDQSQDKPLEKLYCTINNRSQSWPEPGTIAMTPANAELELGVPRGGA